MYHLACNQWPENGETVCAYSLHGLYIRISKREEVRKGEMDERGEERERRKKKGLRWAGGWNEILPDADRWDVQALVSRDYNLYVPLNCVSDCRHT